ncbi:MAG: ABC transporter substrate-binding protein [Acidimicrobiia bacterium]
MRRTAPFRPLVVLLTLGLLVAACGDDDDTTTAASGDSTETTEATEGTEPTEDAGGESGEPGDGPNECVQEAGLTEEGQLTIGTDSPAFPPWFVDDDPTNGEGFESAVAYAVAEELGFSEDQVEWTVVPFNNAFAPGPKDFDFVINQVSITEERDQAIDFSEGYYDVNQAIVGFEDSAAAGATTVEDLRGLKLGAQQGTTSLDFITEVIQPEQEPFVYNDNSAAKAALDAQQVDAIVLDLPTAFYVSAVEIEGTAVIGQFPSTGDSPEQFGMVFEDGNPLRDCVDEALASLEESGDLDAIEQEWLSDVVDAPVIEIG